MKPRNFPARRLARQIAAATRQADGRPCTAQAVRQDSLWPHGLAVAARNRRSKKRRGE